MSQVVALERPDPDRVALARRLNELKQASDANGGAAAKQQRSKLGQCSNN